VGTFQVRVEDYTGTITDTTALSDQLTAGAKSVINLIPENRLDRYASDITDSGSGASISSYRFVRAHKNGRRAIPINPSEKWKLYSKDSLYTVDTRSPSWYLENGKIYVVPDGGTVVGVVYPSVLYNDTTVPNFPTEIEQAVILYCVIQQLLGKTNTTLATLDALTIDTVTAPTAPTAPIFTFTDTTYTNAAYTDALIDTISSTTIGDLGTVPTYTKPTISMTAAPTDLDLSAISIPSAPTDFSLTATPPSAPTDASYSYVDAVIGTYTATTIGSLGTAPTYTKPTTTFDMTNATSYIATEEDIEKASVEINKQATLLEQFGKDLYNELNEFNKELEIYKSTVQNAFTQAQLDQERLMIVGKDTTNLNIQNEIQTLQAAISLYQSKLGKYQGQISSYQAQVNAEVQSYGALLQKFSEQLNSTKVQVDKAVQQFRANLEKWQTLRQTEIAEYNANIQNELNEFNKELSIYQTTVQKAIHQADLNQQRLIQQSMAQIELNKFNEKNTSDIDAINKSKALEADIINRTKDLEQQIQEWQGALGRYHAQNEEYGMSVNKAVQKLQAYIQKYLGEAQANTQLIEQVKTEFKQIVSML